MSQEASMKSQTCVLKVGIHCDGCKKTVDKVVHKIEGVQQVDIDKEEGKVTVLGNVDPAILLKMILKTTGKRAQLWGSEGGNNNHLSDRLEGAKGEQKDNDKPQKGCGGLKNLKVLLKGLKLPLQKDKKL